MSLDIDSAKFPGKVLFIDNRFDEIQEFFTKLASSSVSVQYWDPNNALDRPITNVRIVILDLYLKNTEDVRGTPSFYIPAAEALRKITGPFILFIFSDGFDSDKDICGLCDTYSNLCKKPLSTIGKITGIEKESTTLDEILIAMKSGFEETDILKMISTWDNLLNEAKDNTLLQLAEEGFEKEIQEFVKASTRGIDDNSIPREFASTMIRLISRHINNGSEFEKFGKILARIRSAPSSSIENPLLQHLQMYHKPSITEKTWTGDIYEMKSHLESSSVSFWNFSLVLTPACDIAQKVKRKLETFLLCDGCVIDVESVKNPDHPFRKNVNAFKFPTKEEGQSDTDWNKNIMNTLNTASTNHLPEKYYVVWHFKLNGNYVGICFDFQRVRSIKIEDMDPLLNGQRSYRLDSPFVDDILQKFGSFANRLGTPEINLPSKN